MKRFTKRGAAFLILFTMLMYLCACGTTPGSQNSQSSENTQNDPPGEYVVVRIGFNPSAVSGDDDSITYTASAEDIVQEVDYDEYYDWAYAIAKEEMEDDMEPILDIVLPGYAHFYFKGVAPGETTLVFSGGGMGEEMSCQLKVLDDLKVQATY